MTNLLPELKSILYGVLVGSWTLILTLYVYYFFKSRRKNKAISILIIILAIDAFRTLIESAYFGLYFSHFDSFNFHSFLSQPSLIISPKLLNLASALLIIFLLIKHWIPSLINNELRLQHDVSESEVRRNFALNAANIGDWDMDLQTNIARRSLIHDQCFGYKSPVKDWGYDTFLSHVHPEERDKVDAVYKKAMNDGDIYDVEFRVTWPDNSIHWLWSKGRFYNDDQGRPIRVSGIQLDITKKKYEELALRINTSAIEALNSAIVIADAQQPDMPIVYVNPAFEKITGYNEEEVLGWNYRFLNSGVRDEKQLSEIRSAIKNGKDIEIELLNKKKDGSLFWSSIKISPLLDKHGIITHFVGIQSDISEIKNKAAESQALHEKIKYLAYYDSLTGLPNSESINKFLQSLAESSSGVKKAHTILLMDVDNFKKINVAHGRHIGDLFIKEIVKRVKDLTEKECFFARLTGTEFILVMSDQEKHTDTLFEKAKNLADSLLANMRAPIKLNDSEIFPTVSIGLNLIKDDSNIFDAFKQTSLAVSQAKNLGKDRIQIFDNSLEKIVNYRAKLEAQLRHAIERSEFELHYQPQVNAHNKIFGCEALIRWQSLEMGGNVLPSEFIPIAEQTSLMLPIGQWVLVTACETLDKWHHVEGFKEITLSVNISAIQFKNSNFVANLDKLLSVYNFNPSKLKLELTESILADDVEAMINVMNQIKEIGLTISLDDFGTGFSSLSYLKSLPIDQLKIDRAFVKDISTDRNQAFIAEAIIKLAQVLGLEIIAEGVETEQQKEYLTNLGCSQFQGFLYSKALNIVDFEKFSHEFNN